MLTNKITGFSADLLDTVKNILGEANKCGDCGCGQCECEKEETKEGYMPTADEPTDANKKTADKVRAMLAKEKKPVKEESGMPFEKPYKKVGERKDEYGNKVKNVARHLAKKAMKANEEIEQVDELSRKTLGSYVKKASQNAADSTHDELLYTKSHDDETAADYGRKAKNRLTGISKAADKLTKEGVEQVDEISSDMAYRYLKGKRERDYDISADGKSSKLKKPQSFGKMNKDMKSTMRALRTIEKSKKTNEEVEDLDEISKATMGRYINKAKDSIDIASYRQGNKEALGGSSRPLERKLSKRHKGIETAVKKLTKEESEQIDELSKDTMGRYIRKAATKIGTQGVTAGLKIAKDERSQKNFDTIGKRERGIAAAVKKLTKEESEQIDELSKKTLNSYVIKSLAPSSQKSISNLASKGGYEHGAHGDTNPSAGEKEDAKSAKRSLGVLTAVRKLTKEEQDFIDALNDADMEQIDELSVVGLDKYHSKAYQSMFDKDSDKKTVAKRKKGMDMAYNKAGFGKAKVYASEEAELEEGEEKGGGYDGMPKGLQDRAPRGRARNAMGRAIARQERNLAKARMDRAARKMEEEVEQVDEVSKNLMLRYVSANKKSDKAAQEKGDYSKSDRRMRGTDVAVRKYTATNNKYVRVPATEEVDLDEARGRPRKAGAKDFTIHPKTKEKLMHDNPADMKRIEALQKTGALQKPKTEANQHIINQLQKAKLSMQGGTTINFTHGDSKHVSGTHAAKILGKYAGMKPDEKEAFQKDIGHSHARLMKHV